VSIHTSAHGREAPASGVITGWPRHYRVDGVVLSFFSLIGAFLGSVCLGYHRISEATSQLTPIRSSPYPLGLLASSRTLLDFVLTRGLQAFESVKILL
jgi:hypothetical protein